MGFAQEVGTVIENADGTPSRRDEIRTPIPVPSPRQHPKPFPGTMSVSVTPSAPVSPPSPSKLATLQRSASSTGSLSGLSDYRGRYEREILNNSNKSSSRREIIHVPGEVITITLIDNAAMTIVEYVSTTIHTDIGRWRDHLLLRR